MSKETELQELRRKYDDAVEILSTVIGCGYRDVDCVLDMVNDHPDTVECAKQFGDDVGSQLDFGCFVRGVHYASYEEIEDDFKALFVDEQRANEHFDSLRDMIIDSNYCAWGGVACYGSYHGEDAFNEELQNLFSDYVTGSFTKSEFLQEVKELIKSNKIDEEG